MEIPHSSERIRLFNRIHEKVVIAEDTMCWIFRGKISTHGRKKNPARVMYSIVHGHFPKHRRILKICGVEDCCNPSHLRIGGKSGNQHNKRKKK